MRWLRYGLETRDLRPVSQLHREAPKPWTGAFNPKVTGSIPVRPITDIAQTALRNTDAPGGGSTTTRAPDARPGLRRLSECARRRASPQLTRSGMLDASRSSQVRPRHWAALRFCVSRRRGPPSLA